MLLREAPTGTGHPNTTVTAITAATPAPGCDSALAYERAAVALALLAVPFWGASAALSASTAHEGRATAALLVRQETQRREGEVVMGAGNASPSQSGLAVEERGDSAYVYAAPGVYAYRGGGATAAEPSAAAADLENPFATARRSGDGGPQGGGRAAGKEPSPGAAAAWGGGGVPGSWVPQVPGSRGGSAGQLASGQGSPGAGSGRGQVPGAPTYTIE